MQARFRSRRLLSGFLAAGIVAGGAAGNLLGTCGPFVDVAADAFCAFVFEAFALGITTGTTPTTYDPTSSVSRLQMAAFLSRGVDATLRRGGKRAALNQFWSTGGAINLGITTVATSVNLLQADGLDVWAAVADSTVVRIRAGDGRLLETWTGAGSAYGVLVAMGKIFSAGSTPGKLYRIDPAKPAGAVTTLATNLGNNPSMMAFDGQRIWTANTGGSVSFVTPTVSLPWTVTTVAAGFTEPAGIIYDGSNIWITDLTTGALRKLDTNAAVLQTVTVGSAAKFPIYDGTNIWVPNLLDASVTVVRASNGVILATLTGNGLSFPNSAAFDGQRILVTNGVDSVSLWKAADFTPLGNVFTGASSDPVGACSDGVSFWIGLSASQIARF